MSKNTELFINLCNFMKYFVREVLPENEPTDLLKHSTKELILALINYTEHIKCDISPVSFKTDRPLSVSEVLIISLDGGSTPQMLPETGRQTPDRARTDKSSGTNSLGSTSTQQPSLDTGANPSSGTSSPGLCSKQYPTHETGTNPSSGTSSPGLRSKQYPTHETGTNPSSGTSSPELCSKQFPTDETGANQSSGTSSPELCSKQFPTDETGANQSSRTSSPGLLGNHQSTHETGVNQSSGTSSPGLLGNHQSTLETRTDPSSETSSPGSSSNHQSTLETRTDSSSGTSSPESSSKQQSTHQHQNHLSLRNDQNKSNHIKSIAANHDSDSLGSDSSEFSDDNEEENDVKTDLDILSECFLKTLFLSEPQMSPSNRKNVKHSKNSPSKTDISKTNATQMTIPPRSRNSNTISPEFVEVSRCLLERLLVRANYCWECGFSIAEVHYMQNHLEQHNAENPDPAWTFELINICEECRFYAVIPKLLAAKYQLYHMNQHSLPSINVAHAKFYLDRKNRTNHLIFVKNLLIKKTSEETVLPNFLGACLICNSFFNTPLEWNCHLYEFQHLRSNKEKLLTCSFCCIVILGFVDELRANDYLNVEEHVSVCRGRLLPRIPRRY